MNEENNSQTAKMIAEQMIGDLMNKTFSAGLGGPVTPQAPMTTPPQGQPAQQVQPVMPEPVPAPTAEPAPTQPAPEPTDTLTSDDKRAHAFANLRYENKQLSGKVSEYEKQMAEMQAKLDEQASKYSELENSFSNERKLREEMEDKVGKANLAESKEFRERFDVKRDKVVEDLAKVIIDKTDVTDLNKATDFAAKLMTASETDVLHAIEKLPSYVQGSIYNLVKSGKEIDAERTAALEQWRTTQAGLTEAAARERVEQANKMREAQADAALTYVRSANVPAYAVTDPAYADMVKKAEEQASAFIKTATSDQLMNAAMEGAMAPVTYALIDMLRDENQHLREQLEAGHKLSAPPISTGYTPVPTPMPEQKPAPMNANQTTHAIASNMIGQLLSQARF